MSSWKEAITRRFDAAVDTYDAGADCQLRIALALRRSVLEAAPSSVADVLEIGCGTGFLTRALLPDFPEARWLATDIAPRMVERCGDGLASRISLQVMDGEWPDPGGRAFDLIVSNMAVQWFADLEGGLRRLHGLLRPGGLLAVTTLGAETFLEWRYLCQEEGVEPATPPYPTLADLRARLGAGASVARRTWPLDCGDLHGFLTHLKATGARAAALGQPSLSPALLHRLLRTWEGRPFGATYDVLTVLWPKER